MRAISHSAKQEITMEQPTARIEKVCLQCLKPFSVKPSRSERKFCSGGCKTAHETAHGRPAAHKPMIEFNCRECGKPFTVKPADVRFYNSKYGKDPAYCSIPCSAVGRRKDTMLRQRFTCLQCGKEQSRRRKPGGRVYAQQKFCNTECKAAYQRSTAFERFNEGNFGRHLKRNGYVWISVPALANNGKKTEMLEHRYV